MPTAPVPPFAPALRRRDDLAGILRDALYLETDSEMDEEALLEQTALLLAALKEDGIDHVLVGGLAMLQYVEGRNTRDIDLILAVEDVPRLPGFVIREKNNWFGTGDCGPLRVDLRFTTNPLFADVAARHAVLRSFRSGTLRCATPEGILLLKLFAMPSLYRQGQIERADLYETDILQLLRLAPVSNEVLLGQLHDHVSPSDLKALAEVLVEVRGRLQNGRRFLAGDGQGEPTHPVGGEAGTPPEDRKTNLG
jgi:hypothetical protein